MSLDLVAYRRMLEEESNSLHTFNNTAVEEEIRSNYGVGKTLAIHPQDQRPISPRGTLLKAADYVLKQKNKGVNPYEDKFNKPEDVFKSIINSPMFSIPAIPTKSDDAELVKSYPDSKHKLFLTASCVVSARKELRSLPYVEPILIEDTDRSFMDSLRCLVYRTCQEKQKMLSKRPKSEDYKQMMEYVIQVSELKEKKIKSLIEKGLLITEKLSNDMKMRYLAQNATKQQNSTSKAQPLQSGEGKNLEMQMYTHTAHLPGAYKVLPDLFDDTLREVKRKQILTSISTQSMDNYLVSSSYPILRQPESKSNARVASKIMKPKVAGSSLLKSSKDKSSRPRILPAMSQAQIKTEFWKLEDPLGVSRKGPFCCSLNTFDGTHIEAPSMPQYESPTGKNAIPMQMTSINLFKTVSLLEEIDEEDSDDGETHREPKQELPTEDAKFSFRDLSFTSNISSTSRADMAFLMKQNPEIMQGPPPESHKRLESIWTDLGFSVHQRLAMVVKYTKDIEESGRLNESLVLWERSKECVEHYNACYHNLKIFLHTSPTVDQKGISTFLELRKELLFAENSMLDTANRLKQTYGDDLIIQRKPVSDFVQTRKMKLSNLIFEAGFGDIVENTKME